MCRVTIGTHVQRVSPTVRWPHKHRLSLQTRALSTKSYNTSRKPPLCCATSQQHVSAVRHIQASEGSPFLYRADRIGRTGHTGHFVGRENPELFCVFKTNDKPMRLGPFKAFPASLFCTAAVAQQHGCTAGRHCHDPRCSQQCAAGAHYALNITCPCHALLYVRGQNSAQFQTALRGCAVYACDAHSEHWRAYSMGMKSGGPMGLILSHCSAP